MCSNASLLPSPTRPNNERLKLDILKKVFFLNIYFPHNKTHIKTSALSKTDSDISHWGLHSQTRFQDISELIRISSLVRFTSCNQCFDMELSMATFSESSFKVISGFGCESAVEVREGAALNTSPNEASRGWAYLTLGSSLFGGSPPLTVTPSSLCWG